MFNFFKKTPKKVDEAPTCPDGKWLELEKCAGQQYENTGVWRKVAEFAPDHEIDLNLLSCFEAKFGTFAVLRTRNHGSNYISYIGCIIHSNNDVQNNSENFVKIIVDRYETPQGDILKSDDWTDKRVLTNKSVSGFETLVQTANKYAVSNNYKTLPPYVFWLTMSLAK
jgi:hypothetical protein